MRKIVLLGAALLCLAGCNKSDGDAGAPGVAAANEEKLDLKGTYPGMSKEDIEKVLGKMTCMPSAQILDNIEINIHQAEKDIAQNAVAGQPPNDTSNAARQNAEQLVQIKTSGRIKFLRALYKGQLDTLCIIPKDGGQTYVNKPVAVEVGLRNGKAKTVNFDVIGVSSDNIIDALMIKYKWAEGAQNGSEQYLIRMQRGMSLMQGITDGRNNTLTMAQSPDEPNAVRLNMTDSQTVKAITEVQRKINEEKTGAPDA